MENMSLVSVLRSARFHAENCEMQPSSLAARDQFEEALWAARRALSRPSNSSDEIGRWRSILENHVTELTAALRSPDRSWSVQALKDECSLLIRLLSHD
jgi:hypothetical protein